MVFLLLFALVIFTQVIFSHSFLSDSSILIQIIGFIQLLATWSSFLFIIVFFSQRKHNDYKKGFSAFSGFILFGVPAMIYLIPGLLFLSTEN
ncbi:MAG: hypothetical protein ACKO6A_04745, partial [Bacteroidota bacterium]